MSTIKVDTVRPVTADASLTLQGDNSGTGVSGITIDSSGVVNTTTAKVTNIQATSGQSLTIKDEDGNAAITIGTDNTAASYLSLNFGSYHGDSGGAGSGSLSANILDDYEEGTWTITLHDANSGGNQSDYSTTGTYVKIGNLVTVTLNASVTFTDYSGSPSNLASTNVLYFSLPFTPSSTKTASGSVVTSSVSFRNGADACISPIVDLSATRARFRGYSSGDASSLLRPAEFNGGSILNLTLSYFVD